LDVEPLFYVKGSGFMAVGPIVSVTQRGLWDKAVWDKLGQAGTEIGGVDLRFFFFFFFFKKYMAKGFC
jgi:hypothetical protein